jgi:hypothetical protein
MSGIFSYGVEVIGMRVEKLSGVSEIVVALLSALDYARIKALFIFVFLLIYTSKPSRC